MKVRIGSLEVSDISLDELDELIKRYGGSLLPPADTGQDEGTPAPKHHKPPVGNHGGTTDMVILKKLIDAGTVGIPTKDLGEMLGRRGKATYGAARKWATRVHLAEESVDPFDKCRIGTVRAIRIKPSLMDVAKAHLQK